MAFTCTNNLTYLFYDTNSLPPRFFIDSFEFSNNKLTKPTKSTSRTSQVTDFRDLGL